MYKQICCLWWSRMLCSSLFVPNVQDLFFLVFGKEELLVEGCSRKCWIQPEPHLLFWFSNKWFFLWKFKNEAEMKMRRNQHRWMETTPKMSTWRRLLINFRFTILHRKSFPCSYFFSELNMLLRLFIYARGKQIHHNVASYTFTWR